MNEFKFLVVLIEKSLQIDSCNELLIYFEIIAN